MFTQTLSLLRPRAQPAPGANRPTLGVLVAAHNEASVLPITLRALFAQDEPADLIVVADDGSQDGTAALLTGRFGLTAPVLGSDERGERHASEPALAAAAARRQGARPERCHQRPSTTELVLTVDGDTLLDPAAVPRDARRLSARSRRSWPRPAC